MPRILHPSRPLSALRMLPNHRLIAALLLLLGAAPLAQAEDAPTPHWSWSAAAIEHVALEAMLAPTLHAHQAREVTVRRGETLDRVLSRLGVADGRQRHAALSALDDIFDPRTLRAGQSITVYHRQDESGSRLTGFAFQPEAARIVHLTRNGEETFRARDFLTPLSMRVVKARGAVGQSLYVDATRAGAHHSTVLEIADLLAYSVDFQREIHPGDPFEIVFEEWVTPDGDPVRAGNLLYVSFAPQGRALEYWRFVDSDGREGYYDSEGRSARRLLMKTPINGARLSSHFGNRRHPILGYTRMHKGTDFAAPRGTPIYAAGDGVVERANRYGGFGNYIRIRHPNGYKTAYAHLNGFARGVRAGARVRQGQTIGYVGTTGRSTGPHLHYEVMLNGNHINPMRLQAPRGERLATSEFQAFEAARIDMEAVRTHADRPAGAEPPPPAPLLSAALDSAR